MTTRLKICDLPQELLLHILALVGGKDLIQKCSLVCREWKAAIDSSVELQLCVELWADGMVSSFKLKPSETLSALYDRRRAWLSLQWTARTVLEIEPGFRAYDLVGGVFGRLDEHYFKALWLPSARDPTVRRSSGEIANFPRDFVMDPTQDLVAFVSQRHNNGIVDVDCRTLSSLVPHPAAASPLLTFSVGAYFLSFLKIDIAGDIISLFFDASGRIALLDWRKGLVLEGRNGDFPVSSPISFTLVSPRAYILGFTGRTPLLEIWIFDETEHTHKATLQLPELNASGPGLRVTPYFTVHSSGYCAHPHAGRPFFKSSEERIFAILFDFDVYIFVHYRYLWTFFSAPAGSEAPIIPWDEWGPRHTRMLSGTYHWLRYMCGERVILSSDRNPTASTLQVLDFGMSASRSEPFPGEPAPFDSEYTQACTTELHTDADILVHIAFVAKSVVTSLPYRKTVRSMCEEHLIFILDEEQIIGVNEERSELTVFTF